MRLLWPLLVLVCCSALAAQTHTESTDAGDMPGTAQATTGTGALTTINGNLTSTTDVDIFIIRITNAAVFSASLVGSAVSDTQIWLFQTSGMGIAFNDDDPGASGAQGVLPQGNSLYNTLPVGNYLIAVSSYNLDANSAGGAIFPNSPFTSVHGPTGAGGGSALNLWSGTAYYTGSYTLSLTGCSYSSTPGPTPTINVVSTSNPLPLGSTPQGTPGTPASYTVSGSNLTANIVITAPSTSVEVSTSSTSGFGNSVTLTQSGGSVASTTIYARISAAAPQGAVSGNITHTSTGATQQNLAVSGTVTAPTPSINVTSGSNPLNLGTTVTGTAGTPASYTVTGANLTADIVVTAPANVELSQTGAAGTYAASQTLARTGSSVNATVHARIAASAPVGAISGNITHTSTGATTQNLAVTGNVTVPPPTINIGGVTPPLNLGTTFQGTAGTPTSYTVTGSNLTADIVVTAPANVEISQTGAAGTYATAQTLTQTGGSVNATIHARIAASASVGAVSGNITHTSTGATTQNLPVTGTVNPTVPDMTVARGATSVADGGTDALGNLAFGTATSLTYTIGNAGTAALNLTGTPPVVATAGTNCSITVTAQPASTSVPVSGTVTFTVSITPTAAGAFDATISIANTDSAKNPYNWTIGGTGVAAPNMTLNRGAAIADGGTDAIGNVSTTIPLTLTYTVGNSGNAVLTLNGTPRVAISGATNCVVSVTTQPAATVAVAATTTFVISVRATGSGAMSFAVSIANDDPGTGKNPYNFTVNGTGAGGVGGGGAGGGGGGGGGCQTGDVPSHAWLLMLAAFAAVAVALRRARA